MADEDRLRIRPLLSTDTFDDLKAGSPGEEELKAFLVDSAWLYMRERLATTYVLAERLLNGRDKIVGYVSLLTSVLDTGKEVTLVPGAPEQRDGYDPHADMIYPYAYYPAIRIGRLLIDSDYRRRGLGRELVDHAIDIAEAIGGDIGCRFVVVDAKPDAMDFWQHFGFTTLDTKANRKRRHMVLFHDLIHVPRHDGRGDAPGPPAA